MSKILATAAFLQKTAAHSRAHPFAHMHVVANPPQRSIPAAGCDPR